MKRILAFVFFLLFLAGIALVNLKGLERAQTGSAPEVTATPADDPAS